ncbi:hypothetical protein NB705_003579 [Xanthomonas sacchari]|nr:hypothetical protein [Xanthomonas sacchari]
MPSASARSSAPASAACSASKVSALANQRRAWRAPIAAITYGEITAGSRPSRLSLSAKRASVAATAMSQQATRPTAPPNAAPCTRATVGLGSSSSRRISRARASASSRFSCSPAPAIERIHCRSAPAENAAPAPASTSTCTCGSAPICSRASLSWTISAASKALRTSGRFNCRVRTLPDRCNNRASLIEHARTKGKRQPYGDHSRPCRSRHDAPRRCYN